jgi:hypothetical protein
MSKEDKTSIVSRAKGVVEQYGSYLKEHTMKIKDVADPPCPKENLKIAI